MLSTMQDFPLTINMIYQHGRRIYADSKIYTFEGDGYREASFGAIGDRAERLAGALRRLGVRPGVVDQGLDPASGSIAAGPSFGQLE